jgi:3-(3-hydroxy-phenyl)propionate hydroxylase
VLATYVLGCDGANSVVRTAIGSTMEDLKFEQRWLVIDVASTVELDQWEGVHQVCDPERAATYMRIGDTRYRWEFRLLPGETAADFESIEAVQPLIGPWGRGHPVPPARAGARRGIHLPGAAGGPLARPQRVPPR